MAESKDTDRKVSSKKVVKKTETTAAPQTIKMVNEIGKTADVHPDMVEEYRAGGFAEAK